MTDGLISANKLANCQPIGGIRVYRGGFDPVHVRQESSPSASTQSCGTIVSGCRLFIQIGLCRHAGCSPTPHLCSVVGLILNSQ
jgi:hypothetical protein